MDRLALGKLAAAVAVAASAAVAAVLGLGRNPQGFLPAPPHDERGHTWHHPDRVLFEVTKLGVAKAANLKDYKTRMPVFEGILEDKTAP